MTLGFLKISVQLIYKKKGGSAGSGAGAALTKLTESSQCLYAGIAFALGRHITNADVTEENAKKYSNMYDTDEKLESMLNDLPDIWIESSVLGANKLWDTFGGKGKFVFHRGSKTVDRIENNWIKDLTSVDLDSKDFWIENRKYIQNDKFLKHLLKKRNDLWRLNVREQLSYQNELIKKDIKSLDSIIQQMDNEKYFLYWKID